jgi:hypothetical protein
MFPAAPHFSDARCLQPFAAPHGRRNVSVSSLSQWITDYAQSKPSSPGWALSADAASLRDFFVLLAENPADNDARRKMVHAILAVVLPQAAAGQFTAEFPVTELARSYRAMPDPAAEGHPLLQLLAVLGSESALVCLAELLVDVPPADAAYVAQICSPLLQEGRRHLLPKLFPRLLDGLAHLSTAAAILDLANYTIRTGLLQVHPAVDRQQRLADMLGQLVFELERIQEQPPASGPQDLAQTVNESVSLAVSLCDALALIGSREHTGKLFRALELPHRRIRTEAAFALARLGEPAGEAALLALAAEPVARLRVLSYAEELGILEKVGQQHRTEVAQAEAALSLWLADPAQLGLPPTQCELFDQRRLYWPGYDEPVECFLFRFAYELGPGAYSNIGISGPLVHSLAADLQDLPPDEIYAIYAGWHAEHPEITYSEVRRLNEMGLRDAARLQGDLEIAGYENVSPQLLGSFFGDRILVALAERDGVSGIAVIDQQNIAWRTCGNPHRPLGATEAFLIHTGKQLLAAFNA